MCDIPPSSRCCFAFVVAGVILTLSLAAERAALAVPSEDPCDAMLTRLSKVGEIRGYSVSTSVFGFTASRDETELEARCSAGHLTIALVEADGSEVNVTFRRRAGESFALEILGQYPEIGTLARTALIDASAEPMTGSLNFAAAVGDGLVFVEFGLAGEVLAAGGAAPGEDGQRVNALFTPTLSTSEIWKDAHALVFAAAKIWDSTMAAHESDLDSLLALAIPSPDPAAKVDSDGKDAVQKCGVATAICLAAAWLPPAGAWACGVALGNCIAALPCLPADCEGDGV